MKKVIALVIAGIICLSAFGFAAPFSGTIQIVGSTSVQPLAEELAQAFMAKNKGVKVFVQGGGSGAGIKAAVDGTADIGSCSRELEPAELQTGIVETVIARDGIAVIVSKSNSVNNLTTEQLQKIYSGQITNWKEVGGPDQKIQVVTDSVIQTYNPTDVGHVGASIIKMPGRNDDAEVSLSLSCKSGNTLAGESLCRIRNTRVYKGFRTFIERRLVE